MKYPSQLRYKRPQWSHLLQEYVYADYVYLLSRALLRDVHSAANLAVHGIRAIVLLSQYPWEFHDFQCLNIS